MARIIGVDIPDNKRVEISLMYIYGVGRSLSRKILTKVMIDFDCYVKDLSDNQLKLIKNELDHYLVEGDLRRDRYRNIHRLLDINCYRGMRHRSKLPVRGQRTKQNARTCKGPKKLIIKRK